MRFKVGDKVSFLNESGGGEITRILDSKMVEVAIDDGFEIPVMAADLVLNRREMDEELPSTPVNVLNERPEPVQQMQDAGRVSSLRLSTVGSTDKGLYLAYEPHDQQWFVTGNVDVYLVNNTPQNVLFSLLMYRESIWYGVDYDFIPAHSKILLETIEREFIEDWNHGRLQAMFTADQPDEIYRPVDAKFDVRSSRFFKEGSYRSFPLLSGHAIVYLLATLPELLSEASSQPSSKEPLQEKSKALINKHRSGRGEAVVDLHIGELLDNIAGLSSSDMFKVQMDYFKRCIESGFQEDYHKITFIHGVGNGILKNAIIDYLKDYEGTSNSQASLVKFGTGAIDVSLKSDKE